MLQALKKIGQDRTVLLLCLAVFLSYLPEAGQYSCFFVYLRLVSDPQPPWSVSAVVVGSHWFRLAPPPSAPWATSSAS